MVHGWMKRDSKRLAMKEKEKSGGTHLPIYSTWVADFMLRQDARKFILGKYMSDKQIP